MKKKILKVLVFIFDNVFLWMSIFCLVQAFVQSDIIYCHLSMIWFFAYVFIELRNRIKKLEKLFEETSDILIANSDASDYNDKILLKKIKELEKRIKIEN